MDALQFAQPGRFPVAVALSNGLAWVLAAAILFLVCDILIGYFRQMRRADMAPAQAVTIGGLRPAVIFSILILFAAGRACCSEVSLEHKPDSHDQ